MINKVFNLSFLIALLLILLLIVLPIPHCIAVRNILFYLLFSIEIYLIIKNRKKIDFSIFKTKTMLIYYLFIVAVLISVFMSVDYNESLREFKKQFIVASLYFVSFVFLIFLVNKKILNFTNKTIFEILFYSFMFHIFALNILEIINYFKTGHFLYRYGGIIYHPTIANYISNFLIAFIATEIICRIHNNKSFLRISNYILFFSLVLVLLSIYFEQIRLGVVSVFFMFFLISFFVFKSKINKLKKNIFLFLCVIVFIFPLILNLKMDSRWNSLVETIKIAYDTKNNTYWRDYKEIPKLSNGNNVSISNYIRVVHLKKGFEMIKEYPLGVGYSRDAFANAIKKKYNADIRFHAHSSIVEFTVGAGIVSFLLWSIFNLKILYLLTISLKKEIKYYNLLGILLIMGFLIRALVDENLRDHNLLIYFMFIGIFYTIIWNESKEKIEENNFIKSK